MHSNKPSIRPRNANRLALVFATFQRFHAAQRLINSVRKYYPDMPIYVADQSVPNKEMLDFYEHHKCETVFVDTDVGVCASRNAAVELVKEPYFLLCDDDFFFGPETNFNSALDLIEDQLDIGIVGGRLFDRHLFQGQTTNEDRFWELFFNYDPDGGRLVTVPVHYFAPEPQYANGVEYYQCDAVMNFAVFRTDIFNEKVRWDPRYKSNGEHEDFYLNFKVNGKHRVVYTPTLVAYHNHPIQGNYQKLRLRNQGWQKFLDKWSLRQFLDLDNGLRVTNMVEESLPYATGYKQYYDGVPLDTRRQDLPDGCLRISNVTGKMVPATSKLVISRPTDTSVLVQVDMGGRLTTVGGGWNNKIDYTKGNESINTFNLELEEICFEVSCSDTYDSNSDFFCYLRPRIVKENSENSFELKDLEVFFSVALGGDYIVFLQEALIDSQFLYSNQWNAISMVFPLLEKDLSVELVVTIGETILYSFSQVISYEGPRFRSY